MTEKKVDWTPEGIKKNILALTREISEKCSSLETLRKFYIEVIELQLEREQNRVA